MIRYLKQYKLLLFLTVLFTAISSLSYVFIAILLQQVMDIVDMGDIDGFIRILLFSLPISYLRMCRGLRLPLCFCWNNCGQ